MPLANVTVFRALPLPDAGDVLRSTPAAGVPVASDGWCRQLCQESLSWLRELDAQPGPLEEWLQRQRNVRRLGFYFAALLEFWVRRCPALGSTAEL